MSGTAYEALLRFIVSVSPSVFFFYPVYFLLVRFRLRLIFLNDLSLRLGLHNFNRLVRIKNT